jgi:hypothetical protein
VHPLVGDAEGEEAHNPLLLLLPRQGTIVPRVAELAQLRHGQFAWVQDGVLAAEFAQLFAEYDLQLVQRGLSQILRALVLQVLIDGVIDG